MEKDLFLEAISRVSHDRFLSQTNFLWYLLLLGVLGCEISSRRDSHFILVACLKTDLPKL